MINAVLFHIIAAPKKKKKKKKRGKCESPRCIESLSLCLQKSIFLIWPIMMEIWEYVLVKLEPKKQFHTALLKLEKKHKLFFGVALSICIICVILNSNGKQFYESAQKKKKKKKKREREEFCSVYETWSLWFGIAIQRGVSFVKITITKCIRFRFIEKKIKIYLLHTFFISSNFTNKTLGLLRMFQKKR